MGEGVSQSYITQALGDTVILTVDGQESVSFETLAAGYATLALLQGVQRGYEAGVAKWMKDQADKAAADAAAEEAEEAEEAAQEAAEEAAEAAAAQEEMEEASRLRVLEQSKFEQVGEVIGAYDEANDVGLQLSFAEKWAIVTDDTLKTDEQIYDKLEDFYQYRTGVIAKPFNAAKLKMDGYYKDASDAYNDLGDKMEEWGDTDKALTDLLVSDPLSTEIATLQATLKTQTDAVRTANTTFASKSHLLDGANAEFETSQREFNLASSALDSTFTDSDVASKLVDGGGQLAMDASDLVTGTTSYLDSFPSLLAAKKATYFTTLRDAVNKTDLDIQSMKDKLPALRDDVATKGSDVRAALLKPEVTADEQLAKLTALSDARTQYQTALQALQTQTTSIDEAVTTRNDSAGFQTLLKNKPSTSYLLDAAPAITDDSTEFNEAYDTLSELHVTTMQSDLASLSDLADVSGTELTESASLLENTAARYKTLQAAEPAVEGPAKTAWQLRMTNMEARLRNMGAEIASKAQDFDTQYETFTAAADKARIDFMTKLGYTDAETTSLLSTSAPAIEMASVDASVSASLGAVPTSAASALLRQRQAASAGALGRTLGSTSQLGRAISRYTGATRLVQSIYSLVRPAGTFALPLAEMPLASSSFLASRGLASSSTLNAIARKTLPFLRVLGASAKVLGIVGLPVMVGLSVAEVIIAANAYNARKYVGGNYGMQISSSTRDNQIMKSPDPALNDTGHDQYYNDQEDDDNIYVQSTSYLQWFNYYLNSTDMFQQSFTSGLNADHAYFTNFASYTMDYTYSSSGSGRTAGVNSTRVATYLPHFGSDVETNAWRAFCMMYDSMNTDIKALVANGISQSDAITQVVDNTKAYVTAATTMDRPMYITRTTETGQEGYTYAMLSGFNQEDKANVLAMIKNGESLEGFGEGTLALMGLPSNAADPGFVDTQAFTDLCNANPRYQAALNTYQTTQLEMVAKATVSSYETLLSQIDPSETDTIRYLQYQLQLLRTANESTLPADMQAQTTSITPEEATTYFDAIYESPSYLSFVAAWQAGTDVQYNLNEFTQEPGKNAHIPSWFSVGEDSVYSTYANSIPNELQNAALEQSVNLVQQLGIFDFTHGVLGSLGQGSFNETHTFETREFDDINTVVLELMSWTEDTDFGTQFSNYRLESADGVLLNNMYTTYKDQLILEGVADPEIGAYNVLLNKIKLADRSPLTPFRIMDEKDATGNSVRTVGVMDANKYEIAHVQALYNADNNLFLGTPEAVLQALGYNLNLTNGPLSEGEDVGGSGSYSATVDADLVQQYTVTIDARDTIAQLNESTNAASTATDGVAPDTTTTTDGVTGDGA